MLMLNDNSSVTPANSSAGITAPLSFWLCWFVASMILFLPLNFIPSVMFFGNWDAMFYGNILAMMSDSIRHDIFYPRWLPQANAGFGSPVMLYYAPLAYILVAMAQMPLAFLHMSLHSQFVIGLYLTQAASGFTSWLWLKDRFDNRTAFIGSLLFILLPYKFIYIYEHLNIAQCCAIAFLPLWMRAAQKLGGKSWRPIGWYALWGSAVYYTHPLTLIAFGAVPACYVLWFADAGYRRAVYGRLLIAHLLAAGICAMQAYPQIIYRSWIHEEGFLTGKFDWHYNLYHIDLFLYGYYGMVAALIAYGMHRCRDAVSNLIRGESFFWALIIGGVVFMNLPLSGFLWEHLPLLKYLQFPASRLHCLGLVGVIYLICVWLTYTNILQKISALAYRMETLATLIIIFTVLTLIRCFSPYHAPSDLTADYESAARENKIIVPPEYKTHWNCVDPGEVMELAEAHKIPDAIIVENGVARVTTVQWNPPRGIFFTAEVASAHADIMLRQCYFPLWHARDYMQSADISASVPYGIIHMTLARGRHAIKLSFDEPAWQSAARWLCALSIVLCCCLIVMHDISSHRKPVECL